MQSAQKRSICSGEMRRLRAERDQYSTPYKICMRSVFNEECTLSEHLAQGSVLVCRISSVCSKCSLLPVILCFCDGRNMRAFVLAVCLNMQVVSHPRMQVVSHPLTPHARTNTHCRSVRI